MPVASIDSQKPLCYPGHTVGGGPDMEISKYWWYCNVCRAQNSRLDGECQFCECGGTTCKRDSCTGSCNEQMRGTNLDRYCPCGECGLDRERWSAECRMTLKEG